MLASKTRLIEVVAEAEPDPVDAKDAPLAQSLQLLGERMQLCVDQVGQRGGLERLLEQAGAQQDAVAPRALGAALRHERGGQRGGPPRAARIGDLLLDEPRIAAGPLVQVRDPQGNEVVGCQRLEDDRLVGPSRCSG